MVHPRLRLSKHHQNFPLTVSNSNGSNPDRFCQTTLAASAFVLASITPSPSANEISARSEAVTENTTPVENSSSPAPKKKGPKKTGKGKTSKGSRRGDAVHVKNYYKMFSNKEALEQIIRQWHNDEKFFKTYKQLFTNGPIAKLINGLPEVTRRGVKERLAKVVDKLEGTTAYDIEASDWDLDLRRERHENNSQQGKTGLFVVMFRRLLDWIFGRDYLDKAMQAGKDRRRILDRLREMGISYEVDDAEMEKLIQESKSRVKEFKGVSFDPFNCTEWPDLDAKEVDDLAGLKLDRLVKGSDVASQEQLEATVPVDLTKESDAQRVQLDEKVPLEAKAGTDAHATDVEKKAST